MPVPIIKGFPQRKGFRRLKFSRSEKNSIFFLSTLGLCGYEYGGVDPSFLSFVHHTSLASKALVAEVNGTLWDMASPLKCDCELQIFTFEDNKGRDTFWHSSAHILGQALEAEYGCKLCIGPCTTKQEGFYYDAYYGGLGLNDEHLKKIESEAEKAVKAKQCFERIEVSREQALEIFSDNRFKIEIINELPADKAITVYRCGNLVDLCRGPHIPNTSFVKAFRCLKASSSTGGVIKIAKVCSEFMEYHIRIKKLLQAYIKQQEEAKKYDHRELPFRMAEFGVLHQNEASGALDGLTRVRRFMQDDAHIFCRKSQLKDELKGVLDFIKYTYEIFGLSLDVELSTRPESYHGEQATWDKAEAILTEALNEFGVPWQINEGDGAFYGPKIDFGVCNALKKKFQCATVQLDFQLPDYEQLDLLYTSEGKEGKRDRPVMIHRAVLGSFERFFGILLEMALLA
ncbi:hypothetical protein ACLB2K_032623 [Fragaria x ananassa]